MAENNTSDKKEHLFKVIIVGSNYTGKTSIIRRYVHQYFTENYKATLGVDFALKVINWDAETVIKLQLWDIAGQDNYEKMNRVYFKDALGAFIVYDVADPKTFEKVPKWKKDIENKVFLPDGTPVPVVLLSNKCDLPQKAEHKHNDSTYLDEYIQQNGYLKWFDTSAKTNYNIDKAMRCLVGQIYETRMKMEETDAVDPDVVQIDKAAENESGRSGFCCF